jgi:hypothetical protein
MTTRFSALESKRRVTNTFPIEAKDGDFFFRSNTNQWVVYNGRSRQWVFAEVSTTTSTSTSTTTTSTSTSSTSTSTSTSSSTSTSTSSSTTTTL